MAILTKRAASKRAAPAAFYDRVLRNRCNASWLPLERNPYRPLYEVVAELVPWGSAVVELGCGTGRLASLLLPRARSYVGLDFAPKVLEEARRYVPNAAFASMDLRRGALPEGDTYVSCETLEHLDDDLGLLERIPRGALVVLSVPSFDSQSHVRHFPERGMARERYGQAIAIHHVEYVAHGTNGRYFHVLRGQR